MLKLLLCDTKEVSEFIFLKLLDNLIMLNY